MIVIVRFLDSGALQYKEKTYVKFENAVKTLVLFGRKPKVRVLTDQVWEATQTLAGKPLVWYIVNIEDDIRDIIKKSK